MDCGAAVTACANISSSVWNRKDGVEQIPRHREANRSSNPGSLLLMPLIDQSIPVFSILKKRFADFAAECGRSASTTVKSAALMIAIANRAQSGKMFDDRQKTSRFKAHRVRSKSWQWDGCSSRKWKAARQPSPQTSAVEISPLPKTNFRQNSKAPAVPCV